MPAWLTNFVILIMTKLTSWLLAKGLEYVHGRQDKAQTDESIDLKLKAFKNAYKEAFDGHAITPEQKQKLNKAIGDFIRNPSNGGL